MYFYSRYLTDTRYTILNDIHEMQSNTSIKSFSK